MESPHFAITTRKTKDPTGGRQHYNYTTSPLEQCNLLVTLIDVASVAPVV
ncbi:unnamed protein product [Ectocarpus sp. 6 AP-2014]